MTDLNVGNVGKRTWTFGGFLTKVLSGILLLLAISILVVIWRILWGLYPVDALNRFQSVAVALLLPMFQSVLTVLVGAGVIKGTLTTLNNPHLAQDKRQQVRFFDW